MTRLAFSLWSLPSLVPALFHVLSIVHSLNFPSLPSRLASPSVSSADIRRLLPSQTTLFGPAPRRSTSPSLATEIRRLPPSQSQSDLPISSPRPLSARIWTDSGCTRRLPVDPGVVSILPSELSSPVVDGESFTPELVSLVMLVVKCRRWELAEDASLATMGVKRERRVGLEKFENTAMRLVPTARKITSTANTLSRLLDMQWTSLQKESSYSKHKHKHKNFLKSLSCFPHYRKD
ncbi:integrase [Striga asiatica]|uniref:Integrase n=1 Tax=Striga asiatica TaxID=4170 RepID=A0A5A7Q6B3_STRAF|nr:integrase [Striga asiatica]